MTLLDSGTPYLVIVLIPVPVLVLILILILILIIILILVSSLPPARPISARVSAASILMSQDHARPFSLTLDRPVAQRQSTRLITERRRFDSFSADSRSAWRSNAHQHGQGMFLAISIQEPERP
jgi:hypothetical protein